MSIDLFGFEWFKQERLFGFWFMSFSGREYRRSLLFAHCEEGYFRLEIFWFRILGV